MKKILIGLFSVALIVGATVAILFWYDRKAPNFKESISLYVYPGMSKAEVTDSLTAHARSRSSVRRAMKKVQDVFPGHYTLESTSTSTYAARMLSLGWETPVKLTLSGSIRSYRSLARKIGSQMMVDSASVADACRRHDTLQLFTRIIPETYLIKWSLSADDILARLFSEADSWWTEERLASASRQGLSRSEVSTLASIVCGETRYVPEQPTIAGVYLNRLRIGMKLQADPTVAFCFNYEPRRILKRHLKVDSPYNTYKYAGLPPGPIACPPKSCLEAVLNPAEHNYLYFCASPAFDGTHRFASNYAQHMKNAREFQTALTKRNK